MIDLKKTDPNVGHLAKPFENCEYVEEIHRWLSRKNSGGPLLN